MSKFTIKNPCAEKWHTMDERTQNRFCTKCSKEVVDFTKRGDSDIVKLLSDNSSGICGRIGKEQLQRINVSNPKQGVGIAAKLTSMATAMLIVGVSNGQEINVHVEQTPVHHSDQSRTKRKTPPTNKPEPEPLGNSNTVSGVIYDTETGEEIPFATIRIKDTENGCISERDGSFTLSIPKDMVDSEEPIVLVFSLIGYDDFDLDVQAADLPMTDQEIEMNQGNVLLGGFHILPEKKWWQFWKASH